MDGPITDSVVSILISILIKTANYTCVFVMAKGTLLTFGNYIKCYST